MPKKLHCGSGGIDMAKDGTRHHSWCRDEEIMRGNEIMIFHISLQGLGERGAMFHTEE